MSGVEIVVLGPDDWAVFKDVRLRALAEAPDAFGSSYAGWVDAPEERWRERVTTVPLNVVARIGDDVVGVASGMPGDDGVELISMWVDPAARGTGTAQSLIDAVVAWAGERPTYLSVRSDNARAVAAYVKAGFVLVGPSPEQADDEPPEDLMVRT